MPIGVKKRCERCGREYRTDVIVPGRNVCPACDGRDDSPTGAVLPPSDPDTPVGVPSGGGGSGWTDAAGDGAAGAVSGASDCGGGGSDGGGGGGD